MPRLVINPGTASEWEAQLRPGINTLGRGFASDFRLEHGSVSTSHCQIQVDGDRVTLKDLGSTNGTFVNQAPVSEVTLENGQSIQLGAVQLRYEAGPPAVPPRAEVCAPARQASLTLTPGASSAPASLSSALPPIGVQASFQAAPPLQAPESSLPALPALRATRSSGLTLAAATPRVSSAASPPLESPDPGLPPIPPPVSAEGTTLSGYCKFHPRSPGRYFCASCGQFFCELCVAARSVAGVSRRFCRHCGTELQAARVQVTSDSQEKGFYGRIPGAFGFPFKGAGIFVLVVGTILISALQFFGPFKVGMLVRGAMRFSVWGLIFQVMVLGYIFAYMQNIIHSTAVGEEEMPPLPSMANLWEDIVTPCLKLLGLVAFCFAPVIALVWITVGAEAPAVGIAILPAFLLSLLYFPMAFLAVALLDSVAAANPLQVIPSILKVPLEYLTTVGLLAFLLGMRFLGDTIIPVIFPRGLGTHSMAKLLGFLAAQGFWSVVCLYLLTVSMRILGLLYVTRKSRLGWLR